MSNVYTLSGIFCKKKITDKHKVDIIIKSNGFVYEIHVRPKKYIKIIDLEPHTHVTVYLTLKKNKLFLEEIKVNE